MAVEAAVAIALAELGGWITGMNYESIGGQCPGCGHGPVYERHVGFVIGGHDQQSCYMRVSTQGCN